MDTHVFVNRLAVLMFTGLVVSSTAQAALTVGTGIQYNDNEGGALIRTVSVYPENSFVTGYDFAGTTERTLGLATVEEYHFVNHLGSYASSGTRIGTITVAPATKSSILIAEAVYTTNDPTGAANFTANTHANGLVSASGEIDVTGLTEGTIFFIYGTNGTRGTNFDVIQGASTVQIAGNSFWENGDTISAVTPVSFTNDGSQNLITYSYTQTNAGKFMGVVLSDTVAPPAATLIMVK